MKYLATLAARAVGQPTAAGRGRIITPRQRPGLVFTPNKPIPIRTPIRTPASPLPIRAEKSDNARVEDRSVPAPTAQSAPKIVATVRPALPPRPVPAKEAGPHAAVEKPGSVPAAAKKKIPASEPLPFNPGAVMASPVQFVESPVVQAQLVTRKRDLPAPLMIVTRTDSTESESVTKLRADSLLTPQIRPSPVLPGLARVEPESGPAVIAIPSPGGTELSRPEQAPSLLPASATHSISELTPPAAASPTILHPPPVTRSPVQTLKESESRITINIGAIEIRAREPRPMPVPPQSPPRALTPAGFEAHAALRSYAPWAI